MRRMEAEHLGLAQLSTRQSSAKIHPTGLAALADWTTERPDATLQYLVEKLRIEQGITVSKATLSKALTKIGFTVKLIRSLPIARNCHESVLARKHYAQMFLNDAPPD